jgi:methyl-accepting chemotaxis protein
MREEAARQSAAVESTSESVERITSSMHNVNASVEALSDTAVETSSAAMEMNTSIAATSGHIDELSQIIDTTASSVVQMTTAIREIAQSADVLNQSTESTASSLQLLTGSVRQVESTARESHQLSDEASKKAEKGIAAVTETVEGMKEIQASFKGIEAIITDLSQKSESIDAVVKVIESVVEQTNLLALNAAIISSQAGEHGRAFSVVAEEVRSLADRTAASTREIAELIESVQSGVHAAVAAMSQGATRVDHGVELSNEAGRILREIGESSEQSTRWAKEIVEATGGQTSDIDQVGLAMNQVKDIATQLNRATHEQDSAGSEITRGVEKMLQLGREVKNATQEQTRESNLITRSVEVVAARIKEILSETQDQSKRADQIQEALQVFREVTEQSTRSAAHTGEIVSDLLAHSQGLEEEIGRFRL